jgi:hypothetical protein
VFPGLETLGPPTDDSFLTVAPYAYSRQWMFDKLIYKCPSRIQMDTDSLLVSYGDYKNILVDNDLHENRVSTVYGIRPKVYGIYGPKETVKTKYKDMSKKAKILPAKLDISKCDLFKCFTNKLCEDEKPLHNDAPLLEPVSENHKFNMFRGIENKK